MKHAFSCRHCGHLHPVESAGESVHPHACAVCGWGVTLNPEVQRIARELAKPDCTSAKRIELANELIVLAANSAPNKEFHTDNWEVLADADPKRLKELGLGKDDVARYDVSQVAKSDPVYLKQHKGRNVVVHAGEDMGLQHDAEGNVSK